MSWTDQNRVRLCRPLYQLINGRLGAKYLAVLVDMQAGVLLVDSTADFLGEILYQIESEIQSGTLDSNLLAYFRSLIQHRDSLVFIFAGTHRLDEMSHDYWSILFNQEQLILAIIAHRTTTTG